MAKVEREGGTSTVQYNINISSGEATPLLEECDRWREERERKSREREREAGRQSEGEREKDR